MWYHTDREETHLATYPPVQGRDAALARQKQRKKEREAKRG